MITREDKELLLQDLCGRLPYGVIVDYKENEFEIPHWKITTIHPDTFDGWIGYDKRVGAGSESGSRPFKIGEVKPYLRSMDSMTKEEYDELCELAKSKFIGDSKEIDWLNKKMFDYRGLIPMNLALEAPAGMYN